MKRITGFAAVAAFLLAALPASAHRYIPNDGSHTSPESAIAVGDPTVSQVVYHDLTAESSPLWITFETAAPFDLWVQFALPALGEIPAFRPELAIIGPGLPEADLPIDVPEGMGALVLETAGYDPRFYDEHFTGTPSWIFREQWVALPEAGRYYLAAYHPTCEKGKLWVALGKREVFTIEDVLLFPEIIYAVRSFHEVADEPMPALPQAISIFARVLRFILFLMGVPIPEFAF